MTSHLFTGSLNRCELNFQTVVVKDWVVDRHHVHVLLWGRGRSVFGGYLQQTRSNGATIRGLICRLRPSCSIRLKLWWRQSRSICPVLNVIFGGLLTGVWSQNNEAQVSVNYQQIIEESSSTFSSNQSVFKKKVWWFPRCSGTGWWKEASAAVVWCFLLEVSVILGFFFFFCKDEGKGHLISVPPLA